MTDHKRVALAQLGPALAQLGHKPVRSFYRRLYTAVVDGEIPAERDNGRLYIQPRHYPLIVEMLCLPSTLVSAHQDPGEPPPRTAPPPAASPRRGEPAPRTAGKRRAPALTPAA